MQGARGDPDEPSPAVTSAGRTSRRRAATGVPRRWRRRSRYARPTRFVHAAFVSHRGAGKSTEILRLNGEALGATSTHPSTSRPPGRWICSTSRQRISSSTSPSPWRPRCASCAPPLPDELLQRGAQVVRGGGAHHEVGAGQLEAPRPVAGVEAKVSSPFFGGVFGSLKALFKQGERVPHRGQGRAPQVPGHPDPERQRAARRRERDPPREVPAHHRRQPRSLRPRG